MRFAGSWSTLSRMFATVATNDVAAVESEVQATYIAMFPRGNYEFVFRAFKWVQDAFAGRHPDFQPIDARYHDLEHTMQGTLCLARLLRCRHEAGATPKLSQRGFELGIIGILLHDSGYLKRRADTTGTGAKYTATHVFRSLEFTTQLLSANDYSRTDIHAVQNMIRCTGIDAFLESIMFETEEDRLVGHALGTADLLGQMSAEDYVDKLPILYDEFYEAAHHDRGHTDFLNKFGGAQDLIQRTPGFWTEYVLRKLDHEFQGLYRFLNQPYPHGPNYYLDRVEANLARIREQLATKA